METAAKGGSRCQPDNELPNNPRFLVALRSFRMPRRYVKYHWVLQWRRGTDLFVHWNPRRMRRNRNWIQRATGREDTSPEASSAE